MADKVYVELTLQQQKALASIVNVEKRINKFADNAEKNFNRSSQSFNVFVGNLAARATAKAFQVLIAGFNEVVTQSVEFDKALREISTILPKDARLTDDLKNSLIGLSTQFATTQAKQAKSYYQIISAGITDTTQAMSVLAAANTLAHGGLADLETTITAITKVMSVYGSEAGSASEISDVLFASVQLGQTRVEDLAGQLPSVISLSKSLGISFRTVSAALTTLTTKAGSTAEATTNLSAIMSSFLKNQSTIEKIIGKNAIATLGFEGALKKLVEKTGSASELQKALGGRIQALNGVLQFASDNFVTLNTNLDKFKNTTGAAKKAADDMDESLDFQWDRFIQGSINAASSLFNFFKPAVTATFKAINEALGFTKDYEKELQYLERHLKANEQALAKYKDVQAEVGSDLEKYKNRLKEEIDLTKQKIAKINELTGAVKNNQAATQQETANVEDSGEVAHEKKKQEALQQIRVQAALAEEEAAIAQEIRNGERTNERFEKLREELELEQAIRIEARMRLAESIAEADERDIEMAKVQEEKRLAIAKSTTKGILKEEKLRHASTRQILSTTLSAMDAFGQLSEQAFGKNFALTKAIALARIPIFVAEGISRAMTLPFPANWIQGAAVAAMGATQLLAVKKQHFQEGGIFDSPSTFGDKNIAAFNGDEAFLTRRMQSNLINLLNTPATAQGSGGNVFNFNGDVVVDNDERIDELASKLSDAVETRNVRLLSSKVA